MPDLKEVVFRSTRFAMMLFALAVPFGTTTLAESLMAVEVEMETSTEECNECVSVTSRHESRKKHLLVQRLDGNCFACQTTQLHSRLDCPAISGHRLTHQQLAPLRL